MIFQTKTIDWIGKGIRLISRRKKRTKAIIHQGKSVVILPGMLKSAKKLYEFLETTENTRFYPGVYATTCIMSAQCAELLLKYKIQSEQNYTKMTHDLYDLYTTLAVESKAAIEKEYSNQVSSELPPSGWDSAESVFKPDMLCWTGVTR
jgi:HEPN domain-containing protein